MIRQQAWTHRPPLEFHVVLDESVLHRQVGGGEVMFTELKCRKAYVAEQRWRTIRFALESWARTARLCVITLVLSVPVGLLAWLIHRR
jgi:Domain of unknown function (DUF5753)